MSLRERNRAETWVAIHNAAASLALEHGWTETTIERIASQAGVSKRTFFNYFPSKEDAILGARDPSIPEAALTVFRETRGDLVHRTVSLTLAIMRASYPYEEGRARRVELIKKMPELASRLKHLTMAVEQRIEPIVLAEIERIRDEFNHDFGQSPEDAARALTFYAQTIIRFAFTKQPTALSDRSGEIVESAITTFREVIQTSTWLN